VGIQTSKQYELHENYMPLNVAPKQLNALAVTMTNGQKLFNKAI